MSNLAKGSINQKFNMDREDLKPTLLGRNRPRQVIKLLLKVFGSVFALILVVALIVVFLSNGTSEPSDAPTLAQCYATEFGTTPPLGVKNLRAKQYVVGDDAGAWLRFEADSNTFSQIISNRLFSSDRTSFEMYGEGYDYAPSWLIAKLDALKFYSNGQWTPGSNYSIAVIAYDSTNRIAYFHHGISH